MKTIVNIIIKEFQQFRRDPKMFAIVLIAPVIQLIFLGYAANLDLENVNMIIMDNDNTVSSRELTESLTSSGYFKLKFSAENYQQVTDEMDKGRYHIALIIPKNFEKKIERHETASLQVIFNGSDGNSASIAAGYFSNVASKYSKNIITEYFNRSGIKNQPIGKISAEIRVWYNPLLKTRNFMVPGIVGLLLSVITLILTSLAIVKEKEIGTLEQLIVTPIKPYQLIIGKLIPFTILGFISVVIVINAMSLLFNIPVKGSYIFLFSSSFLYILSSLGLGLFVSTISKTQQQAMMISIFGILMPMVYLSGFAFPIENMPSSIQYISYLIPLRYFITIIRGVILKGIGFTELWFDATILLAMGIIILVLSSLRFRKKLE
ncbi:MAG TPA: ABC transporter permease [Ignavibacteriaceae bacterium]|nr:ABC transporter permease [Ignavibacteriaceae bacterium]